MRAVIQPGKLNGTLAAPASKSAGQRALAIAMLHHGETIVHRLGKSADEIAFLKAVKTWGAYVNEINNKAISIKSSGIITGETSFDCGESGLAARLLIPIAGLSNTLVTVNGSGTLLNRKLPTLVKTMNLLGVDVKLNNGHLPAFVKGPMTPQNFTIDASSGSQFLSGLLIALSFCTTIPITIKVLDLKSKPYIDLTLKMLAQAGRLIENRHYKEFHIDPAKFEPKQKLVLNIEGDYSGAANFLVAGAISDSVTILGLDPESLQGDKAILEILKSTGAKVSQNESTIIVAKSTLQGFEYDATHTPDLFPILAVLAANCKGRSSIAGLHRLTNKESNREQSICEMLSNFGVLFEVKNDTLSIEGGKSIWQANIKTYTDHRIAMAAAIGAINATGPVGIDDAGCVAKSYPDFFKDLSQCGVAVNFN